MSSSINVSGAVECFRGGWLFAKSVMLQNIVMNVASQQDGDVTNVCIQMWPPKIDHITTNGNTELQKFS